MSTTITIYAGPYYKVRQLEEFQWIDHCADHNFPETAKFCPECGKPAAQRKQRVNLKQCPEDLYSLTHWMGLEEWCQSYNEDSWTVLIPEEEHFENFGACKKEVFYGLPPLFNIHLEKAKEHLGLFQEKFGRDLEYLKKWFEITPCYGVVTLIC